MAPMWDLQQPASNLPTQGPNPPSDACQPFFEVPAEWPSSCRQWDSHRVRLIQYDFSFLCWPHQNVPRQASFVELLFEMRISFASSAPQGMQKLRTVPFDLKVHPSRAKQMIPTASTITSFPPQSKLLPWPMLQESLNLFCRAFNHLQSRANMTGIPHILPNHRNFSVCVSFLPSPASHDWAPGVTDQTKPVYFLRYGLLHISVERISVLFLTEGS